MTDLEKIELSLRRLGDKFNEQLRRSGFQDDRPWSYAFLCKEMADQIAEDECARKAQP